MCNSKHGLGNLKPIQFVWIASSDPTRGISKRIFRSPDPTRGISKRNFGSPDATFESRCVVVVVDPQQALRRHSWGGITLCSLHTR